MRKTERGIFVIVLLIVSVLMAVLLAKAETVGNIKFELIETRAVISCVNGIDPTVKTVVRPNGGMYAVVSCEGSK